jgi:hypothetical protein
MISYFSALNLIAIRVDWSPSSMNCDELDDKFCVGRSRFAYYHGTVVVVSCGLSSFFSLLCIEAYEVTSIRTLL